MSASAFDRFPLATLAGGAGLISLAPILVKAVSQTGLGPTAIAMWRCALGALLLLGAAAVWRSPLRVPRSVMGLLFLAGVVFGLDLSVWHRSIVLVGAGMATILGATQVFVTAILSAVFFGERLTLRFMGSAAGGVIGVALLVGLGSEIEFTADYLKGVGYGLATGVAYGVFLILLLASARRSREGSNLIRLTWFSMYAAVFLMGVVSFEGAPAVPRGWLAWGLLLSLALIAQSFGWWVISNSLVRVKASVGALILLLQPVLATVWGAVLYREHLEPLQFLGALITLSSIYAGSKGK